MRSEEPEPMLHDPYLRDLARAYLLAKSYVVGRGFEEELAWQEACCMNTVSEDVFLREASWVVLSAGMREAVVRTVFREMSQIFGGWTDPSWIATHRKACRRQALAAFNHPGKIDAIIDISDTVRRDGHTPILDAARRDGPTAFAQLPFIGSVTAFHLAKNLGFQVAKPDRHLCRVADHCGYDEPGDLCGDLGAFLDEPVAVVDLVIWRFATLKSDYLSFFPSRATRSDAS